MNTQPDARKRRRDADDPGFVLAVAGVGAVAAVATAVARFVESFGGAVIAGVLGVAFRRGPALQRDTEGLV